ncbi:MAG: N-carbamoyl-D-amino-acid hydrolase [Acidimicrobiales bacterium]|nr:N-carbamoyl-D-amino-acid hydrolase [Acidimicrobiia bacterium]NNE95465.1 N-carbamoyl-D-amino-acid hydrolase [Acidimicrobiales bacterium]
MRLLTVAAAQMGPIAADEGREAVVDRLLALMDIASERGAELVVYPELALTTFFPRWHMELSEANHYYETEMPGPATKVLFDEAKRLGIGFCLGYASLTAEGRRFNVYHLVDKTGETVGIFQKVHIPGHDEYESWREFQHAERHYFEPGDDFPVWRAFDGIVGMAICNDRRWPETYRVMGMQGAELILIGYNTPLHYDPDPTQNALAGFHNALVMQSGAYQNGAFVVGVAKGGIEEGVDSLAQSMIVAPSGQIIAQCITTGDEVAVATIDLDFTKTYKHTLFDFAKYRVPDAYRRITEQTGVELPPEKI